jgi:hypothetical protein
LLAARSLSAKALLPVAATVHHVVVVLTATTTTAKTPIGTVSPVPSDLPGSTAIHHLMDGLEWWALVLALAGLVLGAALWALGAHSQNYQQSFVGKRAVLVSGLAALIVGVGPVLINFFFGTGHGIPNPLTQ